MPRRRLPLRAASLGLRDRGDGPGSSIVRLAFDGFHRKPAPGVRRRTVTPPVGYDEPISESQDTCTIGCMARNRAENGRDLQEQHQPIRNNPSHKADLAAAWVVEWGVRYPRFAVFLTRLLGAAGRETRGLLQDSEFMVRVEAGVPLFRERVELPDRFNNLLGPCGWATFEDMDVAAAREAVLLAEAGDLEGAEGVLVRHFDAETLREGVERLCEAIPEFKVRGSLLLAAVTDHREGRYHASVLVALAQLDGIAYDLTGHAFSGRTKKADHLVVRDSISGHPSGLAALAGVMSRQRGQTTASATDVPYRHGVMHGRDLGYANERVSAKSLAALLALGSWALDRDEREAEPPFAPFDPDDIRLKDLAWAWRETARTLLRVWFRRSNS